MVLTEASAVVPGDDFQKEGRGLVNLGTSLTERGDFAAAEIAFRPS